MIKKIKVKELKKFNLVMGILHFIQGIAMLVLSLTVDKVKDFRVPVWSNFLIFDTEKMKLITAPSEIGTIPFAVLTACFLFLSAFFHFLIIVPKAYDIYKRDIKSGINKFRWYEYSLSSSLMIFLISLLFGVYDIGALILIVLLNASMNLFGLLMEEMNQYKQETNWKPFIFGSLAGIGPWIVIALHAFFNRDPSEMPWFVYAIVGSYFVFFNLFPVNMVLQYRKAGRWADYLYGERTYIILSLLAKTVLAWLVFFGVMQPG